jgi:hypothetical protein
MIPFSVKRRYTGLRVLHLLFSIALSLVVFSVVSVFAKAEVELRQKYPEPAEDLDQIMIQ